MSDETNTSGQIVTANDLLSGQVVYAKQIGTWSRCINDALVLNDEAALTHVLQQSKKQTLEILDPYLMSVIVDAFGNISPTHYREQIRLNGANVELVKTRRQPGYVVMGC